MPSLAVLVPGDLESRTGGYGYDRRIVAGLRERGWVVDVRQLNESFPFPTDHACRHAARVLAELPDRSIVLVDGLAFGAMGEEAERERSRLRLVALVHHPLAEETGLDVRAAAILGGSERRALASAHLVIVTSRTTATALAAYGVGTERIEVVEPGTDAKPLARGSTDGSFELLCVASIIPRKGHETLVDALALIPDAPWRLTCAGSTGRDPATFQKLRWQIERLGLENRVDFVGELNDEGLDRCYDRADIFVLPTFHEGYGMAVAEALARGLPVIGTPTGAIAELVSNGAGLLVAAGDARALSSALSRVMRDADLRPRLAEGARRARGRLSTWGDASTRMAAALERVRRGE